MTTNDQAAMNEQITQLRLNGLSIDGDNRYKQDLIDAVIGAMMFGAQGANPPPSGHWLEQFYVIARDERQALARVEAERDAERARGDAAVGDANEAEAQLAEAVGLLNWLKTELNDFPSLIRVIDKVLARHAQAEQQEAREPSAAEAIDSLTQPLCVISLRGDDRQKALANDLAKIIRQYQGGDQEAQGAQAGDQRIALLERELDRERERADMAEVELQHARAALATQPAYYHDMVEAVDVLEALADGYERGYQDGQSNPSGYNDKLAKHRVAAELLAAVRGAEHDQ